jgi:hypothetical protein
VGAFAFLPMAHARGIIAKLCAKMKDRSDFINAVHEIQRPTFLEAERVGFERHIAPLVVDASHCVGSCGIALGIGRALVLPGNQIMHETCVAGSRDAGVYRHGLISRREAAPLGRLRFPAEPLPCSVVLPIGEPVKELSVVPEPVCGTSALP